MVYKTYSVPKSDLFHARRRGIAFLIYAQLLELSFFFGIFYVFFFFNMSASAEKGLWVTESEESSST